MTKTSLLGTFHIACFVQAWNESTDVQLKKYVHETLLSQNAHLTQNGIAKIWEMFDTSVKANDFLQSMKNLDYFVFRSVFFKNVTQSEVNEQNEKANFDVAFYFAGMFTKGHFEEIPMPQFGYEACANWPDFLKCITKPELSKS